MQKSSEQATVPLTKRVLEEVAAAMGFGELGHVRLAVDFDGSQLRRWGPGEPLNGSHSLERFDEDLRDRLLRLLGDDR